MTTLDEAIKHAEEIAESRCDECGREHRQLAEWLRELKAYREQERILDKIKAEIENIKDIEVVNGGLYVRQYDVVQIIDKYAEQEPCADAVKTIQELMLENEELSKDLDEALKEIDEYEQGLEQEPCDDVVSRQAVLDRREILRDEQGTGYQAVKTKYIRELPPVRPQEPKTGHWIRHEHGFWSWVNKDGERDGWIPDYECSECGSRAWKCETNYCPQCGAKMERSKNNG